jgi:hypothetical protein
MSAVQLAVMMAAAQYMWAMSTGYKTEVRRCHGCTSSELTEKARHGGRERWCVCVCVSVCVSVCVCVCVCVCVASVSRTQMPPPSKSSNSSSQTSSCDVGTRVVCGGGTAARKA